MAPQAEQGRRAQGEAVAKEVVNEVEGAGTLGSQLGKGGLGVFMKFVYGSVEWKASSPSLH